MWRLAGLSYRRAVSVSRKIQKTTFFVNQSSMHHWYGAWRPNGCRQAVPAVPRTQKSFLCTYEAPNTPWSSSIANFTKTSLEFTYSYRDSHPKPFICSSQYTWTTNFLRKSRTQSPTLTSSSHYSIHLHLQLHESKCRLTSNHPLRIKMGFPSDYSHPKSSQTSKSNQNWFVSPGGCSSPPGSSQNPETGYIAICCLAAKPVPPGGSTSGTQK